MKILNFCAVYWVDFRDVIKSFAFREYLFSQIEDFGIFLEDQL